MYALFLLAALQVPQVDTIRVSVPVTRPDVILVGDTTPHVVAVYVDHQAPDSVMLAALASQAVGDAMASCDCAGGSPWGGRVRTAAWLFIGAYAAYQLKRIADRDNPPHEVDVDVDVDVENPPHRKKKGWHR